MFIQAAILVALIIVYIILYKKNRTENSLLYKKYTFYRRKCEKLEESILKMSDKQTHDAEETQQKMKYLENKYNEAESECEKLKNENLMLSLELQKAHVKKKREGK